MLKLSLPYNYGRVSVHTLNKRKSRLIMPVLEPVLSGAHSTWKNLPEPHIDKCGFGRCHVTLFSYPWFQGCSYCRSIVIVFVVILVQFAKTSILLSFGKLISSLIGKGRNAFFRDETTGDIS